VVWIIVLVIHAIILHFIGEIGWIQSFADSAVFNINFALIGFGIWYIVRYTRLDASQVFNTFSTHLGGSLLLVSVWLFASRTALSVIYKSDENYLQFLSDSVLWRGIIGFLYYTIIAVNYYLIQYYQDFQKQKLRESEISRLLRESELSALKSQINPHFIFNSLNSVSSLTLSDPGKAHEMVINLSSFLRYMLSSSKTQLVKLSEELKAVQLYLGIEQIRFGEKLNVRVNCNRDSLELKVPQLILQPLVENAIKYGVYESTDKNNIDINCSQINEYLIVEIVNDVEPGGVPAKGQGIGLKNVKSRLELVYRNPELIEIEKSETKFRVKLSLPQ
jgi:sensor histidine kinase YesM